MHCMKTVDLFYGWFLTATEWLQALFLLGVRMCWGFQFLESGIGKITHMDKAIAFFTDLGIPKPSLNAHFNAGLETLGGVLLILGLASRLISVPLVISMTVAFIVAERDAFVSFFSDPGKFFAADAFPFLFASLLVLIFGPGWFSLDTFIAEYRKGAWVPSARRKLFWLFGVLFIVIYATSYMAVRSSGDSIYELLKWWRLLLALIVICVLAEVASRILTREADHGRKESPKATSPRS
jgi:putative oxidoreductase